MDKLADYYARRAPEYERFYDKPERQADLSLLRERVARLFAGRRVLEIACGTGYWTAVMAREASEVLALDVNPEVLALAREKPLPADRVEFRVADAYALPDLGRRHDGLFAGFWWSHVPRARLDAFLEGCLRAAAPGAMIAFLDGRYVEGSSTPQESELIQRASRFGWGAHVELLPYHWLLTFWAP